MPLEIVLRACARGIVGSRANEAACREDEPFMAVWGDGAPHFTRIAGFVSGLGEEVRKVLTEELPIRDRLCYTILILDASQPGPPC